MTYPMDFTIRRDPSALESTGFVEICPGPYQGKHWQPGCVFVWEDAFGFAEGAIRNHLPDYDHFGMNDIPQAIGVRIVHEWRHAADPISSGALKDVVAALDTRQIFSTTLVDRVQAQPEEIRDMLLGLAEVVEHFYETQDVISVLGV